MRKPSRTAYAYKKPKRGERGTRDTKRRKKRRKGCREEPEERTGSPVDEDCSVAVGGVVGELHARCAHEQVLRVGPGEGDLIA
jgi:hypothetical protein